MTSTNQSNPEETIPIDEVFYPNSHAFNRWASVITGGLIIIGTALLCGLLILNLYTAVSRHGRAVLINKLPPILLLGIIGLSIGTVLILWAKNHWEDHIVIHKTGFTRQKGADQTSWFWDQTVRLDTAITRIEFGGSTVSTRIKLNLEDNSGNNLVIRNNYQKMKELIGKLRSNILPQLYEKATGKLAQNEKINFHPQLIATQEGLHCNEQFAPWEDLEEPISKNNKFILKRKGDQEILFKSSLRLIENLDLLLCLLDNPPQLEN